MYEKKGEEPPCYIGNETTKGIPCRTDPLPENMEAINVFLQVRFQFIMSGMGGPIDINHLAIESAMRREQVADERDCFRRIQILTKWWIERVNEKQE